MSEPTRERHTPDPVAERVAGLGGESVVQGDPSPLPAVSRRTLLLGGGAVGLAGLLGWRLYDADTAQGPAATVERVLDRNQIKAFINQNPGTNPHMRLLQADSDQLELWRLRILPYLNGDTSRLQVVSSIDYRQYDLMKTQQVVELLATRNEAGFRFDVLAARPFGDTRGVWVTGAGRFPFTLATGARMPVRIN